MGRVWNISLPPVTACPKGVPCAAKCYARKAYRQYPATRAAWDHNLQLLQSDPWSFAQSIRAQLDKARNLPHYFRWHVSGDIVSRDHWQIIHATATEYPAVRFLLFTKRHDLFADLYRVNGPDTRLPANLTVVLSAWPGMPVDNPMGLPVAWCQDGTEGRVPETALSCPGNCEGCGMCWELPKLGRDVTFDVH